MILEIHERARSNAQLRARVSRPTRSDYGDSDLFDFRSLYGLELLTKTSLVSRFSHGVPHAGLQPRVHLASRPAKIRPRDCRRE